MILNAVTVREALHVLTLRHLLPLVTEEEGVALRLKGGVNLRLFYGSARYSEDMDLDADRRLRGGLRKHLPRVFKSPALRADLLRLGVPELLLPDEPAKDTETVLRHKVHAVMGGVAYPTKIEISFRGDTPAAWALAKSVDPTSVAPYLLAGQALPPIAHYNRTGAVWQKLYALGNRQAVQARDVFDLDVLLGGPDEPSAAEIDLTLLRRWLPEDLLTEAQERALALTEAEFTEQVVTYLPPPLAESATVTWPDQQLRIHALIERVRQTPVATGVVPTLPPRNPEGARPGRVSEQR